MALLDQMKEMAEGIRDAYGQRLTPNEPVRLTRRQYEYLTRVDGRVKRSQDPPWFGAPVEIIDDPPPSYGESIRDGLERKRR